MTKRNILILLNYFLIIILFYGCPQTFVEMIDKGQPKQDYKPNYITSKISISKLIDSVKKGYLLSKSSKTYSQFQDSNSLFSNSFTFQIRQIEHNFFPDSIILKAIVTDNKGKYITGLAQPYISKDDNFKNYWKAIFDSCQGNKSNIDSFNVTEVRENAAPPYSICFALDHSPSMGNQRATTLQEAVKLILTAIKKDDYISVIKFTARNTLEVPLTNNPLEYKSKFLIKGIKDYGVGTHIYDALYMADSILSYSPKTHKKIIILFTDGMDGGSKSNIDSILKLARRNDITIYTISYGMGLSDINPLIKLAENTNGKFYQVFNSKEFPYLFADIYLALNNYYRISYKPTTCFDIHKVRADVCLDKIGISLMEAKAEYDKSIISKHDPIGTVTFLNLEFEFGKYDVKPESKILLEQIANAMKNNHKLVIQINGHTDDIGDDVSNMQLSEKRAKAVLHELVMMGISNRRLRFAGFGKSKPLAPNDSEENRRKNRRTEFVVMEN